MSTSNKLIENEILEMNTFLKQLNEEQKMLLLMNDLLDVKVKDVVLKKDMTLQLINTTGYLFTLILKFENVEEKTGYFKIDTWLDFLNDDITYTSGKHSRPIGNRYYYPDSSYITSKSFGEFVSKEYPNNSSRPPMGEFIVEYFNKYGFLEWIRSTDIEEKILMEMIPTL